MIIVKSPLRISMFGGSTDYASFYSKYGSFLIGTTINKHVYLSIRYRPKILSNESIITYSKTDIAKTWDDIKNPLIRETLKFKKVNKAIDFNSFSDIPSRTGLGGSSSFCVGLIKAINAMTLNSMSKRLMAMEAITIEREILNEAGGIQDQIWTAYGGLNSIEIGKNGNFSVKPLPVTEDFKQELERSILLIYTNEQRDQDSIAKSHEEKDKIDILNISKEAYTFFIREDIKKVGELLYETWKMKKNISTLISTNKINKIVSRVIEMGAYGAKLLGAGGCGFVLVVADPYVIEKIRGEFQNNIMDIKFEPNGVSQIYLT